MVQHNFFMIIANTFVFLIDLIFVKLFQKNFFKNLKLSDDFEIYKSL